MLCKLRIDRWFGFNLENRQRHVIEPIRMVCLRAL
jgi:hypothetical protein